METLKNYTGSNETIKAAALELEMFIGDMDGELTDDGTVDASDAVRAFNVLIDALNINQGE